VSGAESAGANDGDTFAHMDIVVTEAVFSKACEQVGLDRSQRELALSLHREYWNDIRDIEAETDANMREVGYDEVLQWERENMDALIRGGPAAAPREISTEIDEDELERIQHIKYLSAVARLRGRQLADQRLEDLLNTLGESFHLTDERVANARRTIRRSLFTHDVRRKPPIRDFTVSIDVLALVELASEPGGELRSLYADSDTAARLAAIRWEHSLRLDGIIEQNLLETARRHPRPDDKLVYTPRDDEWAKRIDRIARRLARRYDEIVIVVNEIASLLRAKGLEEYADIWLDRFHATVFPKIYAERCLDGVCEWLRCRADHEPEQLAAVEAKRNVSMRMRRACS
jgi:hypothetical protein